MQLALDGDSEPIVEPLLSAQLHRGWVSDVQLVPHGGDTGSGCDEPGRGGTPGEGHVPLLLTAGNDGALAVWDLALVRPGALHCLAQSPQSPGFIKGFLRVTQPSLRV